MNILKIGHRGAAGYVPENTLASFEKAIALGVDMVELDVHCCKSGELVVIHDETVDRTTSGHGTVASMTLAELQALSIPTLDEVIRLVDKRVMINIELKGKGTALPVGRMIEGNESFLISSFDHAQLLQLKEHYPKLRRAPLLETLPKDASALIQEHSPYALNPSFRKVTKAFIDAAHDAEVKIYVWTVNTPGDIARMRALGVDGIFSDYPDRIGS